MVEGKLNKQARSVESEEKDKSLYQVCARFKLK